MNNVKQGLYNPTHEAPLVEPSSAPTSQFITLVSGLPRSGTSMMMKMLGAGGMSLIIDGIREADTDNPKGYYEFEQVKALDKGDKAWLTNAQGKVVKVISMLLQHLPSDYHYKVIFMRRRLEEMLASQRQMLIRRNKPTDAVNDTKMMRLYEKHLEDINLWFREQPNIEVIYINYNEMVEDPLSNIHTVNSFLNYSLDTDKMIDIIDPSLYRQRQ